ncbi:hypothetical protein C8R42DRAFT_656282 [Lentinula raphanica]|nr:hypothetical protein C8R42DRAFT_656282 [Lentinula raphanica]
MSNFFIVDDQDASIKYTGKWKLAGQQIDYSQTASAGSSGATMSFSFSGNFITAVGDIYTGESCNATFNIDGSLTNFTSPGPTMDHNLYQQTLFTSPTLDDGNHTLIYTVETCNDTQPALWLDYLLYNTSTSPVIGGTAFYDDRDSRIAYTGAWNSTSEDNSFRGTITGLEQNGSLLFDFQGTSVQVFGRLDNTSIGQITDSIFSVDGTSPVTFTAVTSSNIAHNKQLYASRTLNQGQHRLTVNNTGSLPLWVDYILVRGQTTTGNTQIANNTGNSHAHTLSVLVGSVVGGICGILLIITITILLYRRRYKFSFIKRFENKSGQQDYSSTDKADMDEIMVPHRPQFRAHQASSSLSKASSVYESEQRSLTHRQPPLLSSQDAYDTSISGSDASESGYNEVTHFEERLHPQSSYEASYISMPNPYSTRHSHRSYSESSVAYYSVAADDSDMRSSSYAHTSAMPPLTNTPSENMSSNGYGFNFIPTRHLQSATVHEDQSSEADIKQRQGQFFVLSVDGLTASPLVHTDSGIRLHDSPRHGSGSHSQPELPPVYTEE